MALRQTIKRLAPHFVQSLESQRNLPLAAFSLQSRAGFAYDRRSGQLPPGTFGYTCTTDKGQSSSTDLCSSAMLNDATCRVCRKEPGVRCCYRRVPITRCVTGLLARPSMTTSPYDLVPSDYLPLIMSSKWTCVVALQATQRTWLQAHMPGLMLKSRPGQVQECLQGQSRTQSAKRARNCSLPCICLHSSVSALMPPALHGNL